MKGVSFGNYHTYDDFGLILESKEIISPAPKIKQIEVEGSDGVLDFTDFFGGVKYSNRSLSFLLAKYEIDGASFNTLYSRIHDAIHGKKLKISLDDDPGFYYLGRVSISEMKCTKGVGSIKIDVDAEPYKYKAEETVVTRSVSGNASIILFNSRKKVVPTITASAAFTYAWGNYSKSVSAGTFRIPEMELSEGINAITVTGTGTVTFRYQEGGL